MSRQDEVIRYDLAQQLQATKVPQDADLHYNQRGQLGYFAKAEPHYAAFTVSDLIALLGDDFGGLRHFPESGHFGAWCRDALWQCRGGTPQEALGRVFLEGWPRRATAP